MPNNMILNTLLRQIKNDQGYLKIQFMAKQTIKNALSDQRQLLKLAVYALVESWHADPTKFNFLIHGMSPASTISKSAVMNYADSNNYHTTHFSSFYNQSSYTENLIEIIANGAAKLYKKMVKDFTNETMVACTNSNLTPSMIYLDEQTSHTNVRLIDI
jgi:hypothetical protein